MDCDQLDQELNQIRFMVQSVKTDGKQVPAAAIGGGAGTATAGSKAVQGGDAAGRVSLPLGDSKDPVVVK